jgi:nucleotide-binding universal stress UspA family protein
MIPMKRRRSFEDGHQRKYLIVVDDSPEVESALYYAASRVQRASGVIVMLYVIEPQDYTHWMGVRDRQIEEETTTAKALFRLFRRKLNQAGFEAVPSEELIGEGAKVDQIVQAIAADEDISILVLGASTDVKGPGPLVASLAAGKQAGTFPIPITIVPGNLALEDIKSLA